jgi:ABC-2 type transport system permease protein
MNGNNATGTRTATGPATTATGLTTTATGLATPASPNRMPRRAPALGGFSGTFVGLEVRRLLRNRRTFIFTLIMPVFFFLIFGKGQQGSSVQGADEAAYLLVSLAVYGAMVATTAGGASVSVERAQGWSRQLRLTPLRPAAYLAIKVLTAMVLGLASVVVELVAGAVSGIRLPLHVWLLSGLAAWLCALVFAAFGLFMGYLLPSENVMQILGPVLGVLAFFGGLFVPVQFLGSTMQNVARYTPVYGVGEIARYPLTHQGISVTTVADVLVWTAVFAVGAATLFRRDTARV